MKPALAILAIGALIALAVWLWPLLQTGTLNIGEPAFLAGVIAAFLPVFAAYYLIGPGDLPRRTHLGFLILALVILLGAVAIAAAFPHNFGWPTVIVLALFTAAILGLFVRNAWHAPQTAPKSEWDWPD